jgi:hypothetical protein
MDGSVLQKTVRSRVLTLGGAVVALVLAETLYMGQAANQGPLITPLAAPLSRQADPKFTVTLPHARALQPSSHRPSRPVVGMFEGVSQRAGV